MRKIVLIVFASLFIYGCGGSSVDSGNLNDNSESAAINNVNKSVAANSNAEIIAAKESNPAAQNQITYTCANNFTVDATYLNDFAKVSLKINQNGQSKGRVVLPREVSASGIKFGDGKNVWWTKEKAAFFTQNDKIVFDKCAEQANVNQADSTGKTISEKSVDPNTIRNYVGKTVSEAGLKDNKQVNARLQKLLKGDFARMKKDWEFEETIDYSQNVAFANGCKKDNCADNIYLVFYDVKKDNINVYHRTGGKIKTYFEKGKIDLPPSFEGQVGLLKLN